MVWYSVEEFSALLKVSRMTGYRLIHKGKIEAKKFNNQFRVSQEALDRYVKESSYTPDRNNSY